MGIGRDIKLTTRPNIVSILKVSRSEAPQVLMPSWRTRGNLYICLSLEQALYLLYCCRTYGNPSSLKLGSLNFAVPPLVYALSFFVCVEWAGYRVSVLVFQSF